MYGAMAWERSRFGPDSFTDSVNRGVLTFLEFFLVEKYWRLNVKQTRGGCLIIKKNS